MNRLLDPEKYRARRFAKYRFLYLAVEQWMAHGDQYCRECSYGSSGHCLVDDKNLRRVFRAKRKIKEMENVK